MGSSYREVVGLRWVEAREVGPFSVSPRGRLQRAGIRYESVIAKSLKREYPNARVISGLWLRFEDDNGLGWAQPDLLVPEENLLVECKLSFTREAEGQISKLYAPLVERLWGRSPRLVCCCKFARAEGPEAPIADWSQASPGLSWLLR
jgi:hypothetical protein